MRRPSALRALGATAILLLGAALTACAPETPAPSTDTDAAPAATSPESASTESTGDGEYAFGVDRDGIATSIEAAFTTQNGTVRWEGDTLILAVDGDAEATLAGYTECRVLDGLLLEDDVSVVEFPNGQVACADVLAN